MTTNQKIGRPIIALDAMGGDKGPEPIVEGAVAAVRQQDVEVTLVGHQDQIAAHLQKQGTYPKDRLRVVHASEVVDMHDPATAVRQKKDSSIVVANKLVRDGQAHAVVSMGHSGAAMAASLLIIGRLEGVSRPAISLLFPNKVGRTVILDGGANVDCKPEHLLQFAVMGSVYAERSLGTPKPKVALLSIGEEPTKGNELVLGTAELLKHAPLNFIGNVEGRDILSGKADVIVCDGFVGNVVLKFGESLVTQFTEGLKNELKGRSFVRYFGALLVYPVLYDFRKRADYVEQGGAPLLGIKQPSFIGHGRSKSKAVANAVKSAAQFVLQGVNAHIEQRLAEYQPVLESPVKEKV